MGETRPLSGDVVGLSAGIDDANPRTSGSLLANVSPTFNWIRLAQRIPIRIKIDLVPAGVALIAGRSASVSLDGTDGSRARADQGSAWPWPLSQGASLQQFAELPKIVAEL